ncbi:universal stress protein [Alteromonas sp. ASW11-19]|uniref:Universal stress protein n=1 Tax=Alteromonas salexigens TaxID=2982530 RepID=A0ABT2VS35_9ALTE|nr:universal stress protein [Alteromonas salexigens]MCU7556122.1 universal stress protein [Alteromonas salexigens]
MKGHYQNILCVLYDTHKQDEVVAQAIHVAKSHQAKLTIMLALETLPPNANIVMESFSYIDSEQSMDSAAESWLQSQSETWSTDYPVTCEARFGHPFMEVMKKIINDKHDLVIKLSETTIIDRLFGSDDLQLLRKCPCPVWVVHRGNAKQYASVVAALDLNYHYPEHEISVRKQLNLDILRHATEIALLEFAQLHIVHVFDSVPEHILRGEFISVDEDAMQHDLASIHKERDEELDRLLEELDKEREAGVLDYLQPQRHLVHGYPRKEIAATATSLAADVVVMGTVARLGVPGYIMGGTAEETIHQLPCAVVGLKPDGFVSPISFDD